MPTSYSASAGRGVPDGPFFRSDIVYLLAYKIRVFRQINIQFTADTFCNNAAKFPKGPCLGSEVRFLVNFRVVTGYPQGIFNLVISFGQIHWKISH